MFQSSEFITPRGLRAVRTVASGEVAGRDLQPFFAAVRPGGEYFGLPILSVTTQGTRYTPEARKLMSDMTPENGGIGSSVRLAMVVDSVVLRLMIQLVLQVTRAGQSKMFSTEEQAIAYLDETAVADSTDVAHKHSNVAPVPKA